MEQIPGGQVSKREACRLFPNMIGRQPSDLPRSVFARMNI